MRNNIFLTIFIFLLFVSCKREKIDPCEGKNRTSADFKINSTLEYYDINRNLVQVTREGDGVLANSNSLITTRCSTYNPVPVANKKQLDIHDNYRDENDDFKFGIYPNPAKEMANLSYALGENAGNVNISIINSLGATVQQYNYTASYKGVGTFRLDMNELPSGVYFVNVQAKDKTKTLKLSIIK